MKFDKQFIAQLTAELKKPLPGEAQRYAMAPPYRPHLTHEEIMSYNPRLGGVLLLLYEKNGQFNIVFTQRLEYNGVHSAQMSFPGGKKEADDENLVQTALRETYEEVGVPAERIEILGQLSELFIPPSNFLVYPSVGYAQHLEAFRPQQKEVAEIVEIPVDFFLDESNINRNTTIHLPDNHTVEVPAYIFGPHIIWGATAIMLGEFTAIVKRIV